jgi:hypothetical protein
MVASLMEQTRQVNISSLSIIFAGRLFEKDTKEKNEFSPRPSTNIFRIYNTVCFSDNDIDH